MDFYNLYRCLKVISSILTKAFKFILLLLFILFILFFINLGDVKASSTDVVNSNEVLEEIVAYQKIRQDSFAMSCLSVYFENPSQFNTEIVPVLADVYHNRFGISIATPSTTGTSSAGFVTYYNITLYKIQSSNRYYQGGWHSDTDGQQYPVYLYEISNSDLNSVYNRRLTFFSANNVSLLHTQAPSQLLIQAPVYGYYSPFFLDFLKYVFEEEYRSNYDLLGQIRSLLVEYNDDLSNLSKLDDIPTINNTLLEILNILKTGGGSPSSPDYSDTLGEITDSIDSLVSSQNAMLSQQQQTNENLNEIKEQQEQISQGIDDLNNFLNDDNVNSSEITDNMPNSDDYENITQSGFDNIFTTLRNTFTGTVTQDIVLDIPFSNGQTIILSSDVVSNVLPSSLVVIIQSVYWFFISRFIVKDIALYIDKAKSGDIFESSDTNIKTDML